MERYKYDNMHLLKNTFSILLILYKYTLYIYRRVSF